MTALHEQHSRWAEAHAKLMGPVPMHRRSLRHRLGYVMPEETPKAVQIIVETQDSDPELSDEKPTILRPAWKIITEQMCRKHGITVAEILSPRRDKRLNLVRQEIWYRLTRETTMSLPQIGRRFNRDHTSILHGVRKHAQLLRDRGNSQGVPTLHSTAPVQLSAIRESS